MQDFASAQYLKHRVLDIAYLIYLPYLCKVKKKNWIKQIKMEEIKKNLF